MNGQWYEAAYHQPHRRCKVSVLCSVDVKASVTRDILVDQVSGSLYVGGHAAGLLARSSPWRAAPARLAVSDSVLRKATWAIPKIISYCIRCS